MSAGEARLILYRLDQQADTLDRIEAHVAETNGRVRKLELWRAAIEGAGRAVAWFPSALIALTTGTLTSVLTFLLTK